MPDGEAVSYSASFSEYSLRLLYCSGDNWIYVIGANEPAFYVNGTGPYARSAPSAEIQEFGPINVIARIPLRSPLMLFLGPVADFNVMPIHPDSRRYHCDSYPGVEETPECALPARVGRRTILPSPYRHFVLVRRQSRAGACAGQYELGYLSTSRVSALEYGDVQRHSRPFRYEGATFTGPCLGAVRQSDSEGQRISPLHVMDYRWKDVDTLQAYTYYGTEAAHSVFEINVRTGQARALLALNHIFPGLPPEQGESARRFEGARLVPGRDKILFFWQEGRIVSVDFSDPTALTGQRVNDGGTDMRGTLEGWSPGNNPERLMDFEFDFPPVDYDSPNRFPPASGLHYTYEGQVRTFSF